MTRKEQLQDLWDALLRGGFVSSKKEMAQRLGITYHSLSAAFSQGEPYANDRLLGRIRTEYAAELEECRKRSARQDTITIPVEEWLKMNDTIHSQQQTIATLVTGRVAITQQQTAEPKKSIGVENYGR